MSQRIQVWCPLLTSIIMTHIEDVSQFVSSCTGHRCHRSTCVLCQANWKNATHCTNWSQPDGVAIQINATTIICIKEIYNLITNVISMALSNSSDANRTWSNKLLSKVFGSETTVTKSLSFQICTPIKDTLISILAYSYTCMMARNKFHWLIKVTNHIDCIGNFYSMQCSFWKTLLLGNKLRRRRNRLCYRHVKWSQIHII